MNYIHVYESLIGRILLTADEHALTGLYFEGEKYAPSFPAAQAHAARPPVIDDTVRWLNIYFSGRDPGFCVPFSLKGTPFQRSVWRILLSIPYGKTITYGQIAAQLAGPSGRMSAQAVGGAVGRNPVSILVPCHRVIGADGSLTGYAGGIERKARLLALEGVLPPSALV